MGRIAVPRRGALRWRSFAPATLIVLAFLAPGAWLIVTLPPAPVAKALNLLTLGIWLIVFGLGLVRLALPDRRIMWALAAVAAAVVLSFAVGGSHFAVMFYDLYADMPLLQWLAFPTLFFLSAGMSVDWRRVETGLVIVVVVGTALSAILAYQQLTIGRNYVFGSTAYSVTALVPLIPLAVWLAATRQGVHRAVWYACALVVAVALGLFADSSMGTLAVGFALLLSIAVHPPVSGSEKLWPRVLRVSALALAGVMVAGLVFVQVPALSRTWINPQAFESQRNLVSRVYLWEGAQKMVAARPVLGYGPSGYRVSAVDYLDPGTFQFGSDQTGNMDPTVYSPQSPHSLMWEIATRLGVVGLITFGALLVVWALVLASAVRSEGKSAGMRTALAAAFATALFVLLVNPVVFPIGLFVAVAAGLAVGRMTDNEGEEKVLDRTPLTTLILVAGILVVLVSGWQFMGEWKAYTARFEDPTVAVVQYEEALRITPGNPATMRRLLENRLLVASDAEIAAAQAAVDDAPAFIREFAPNLSNFAAYSLAQAGRTGRTDLSWEQELLTAAAAQMPPIPSTVSEQLHLAVLSRDVAAVKKALPDAERWGAPYPYLGGYLEAAKQLTSEAR